MKLPKSFFYLSALAGSAVANKTPVEEKCMKCSYVGAAATEELALSTMSGVTVAANGELLPLVNTDTTKLVPCLHGQASAGMAKALSSGEIELVSETTDSNCAAKFFLYHAKDIDRWIFGVERTTSSGAVSKSQVDLERYEGIKAWSLSISRTTGDEYGAVRGVSFAVDANNNNAETEELKTGTFPANPLFARRGTSKISSTQNWEALDSGANPTVPATTAATAQATKEVDYYQAFAMDGREALPNDDPTRRTNKNPTATAAQQAAFTLCLVCHGSQEFSTQPTISSQVTTDCWNPSSASGYATDEITARNTNFFCVPRNGICTTETWQYSTEDALATTSFWVGITRGCQSGSAGELKPTYSTDATLAADHGTPIGARGMKKFVRTYMATNTAAKAKDNAKYPDSGTNPGSTTGTYPLAFATGTKVGNVPTFVDAADEVGVLITKPYTSDLSVFNNYGYALKTTQPLVSRLSPQFMSTDGSGPPDLPKIAAPVPELECLSCATPLSNTNSENTCVNAKTEQTVKCKTLSCAAVTAAYKLDAADTAETFYYAKRGCSADPIDGVKNGEQAQADSYVFPAGYTDVKQTNQRTTTSKGNTLRTSTVSVAKVFDCYSCDVSITQTKTGSNPVEPTFDEVKEQDTSLCWETFEPQEDTSVAATGTSGRCETQCYVSAYKYKEVSGPTNNPTTTYNWYLKRGCLADNDKMITGSSPSKSFFGVTVSNYVCDYTNGTLCNSQLENYDTNLQLRTQTIRKLQCYTCETPASNADKSHECYVIPSTAKAAECPDLSYTSCFATETSYNSSADTTIYGMKRGCSKEPVAVTEAAVEGFSNVKATTTVCGSSSCNKAAGKANNLVIAQAATSTGDSAEGGSEDVDTDSGATSLISSIFAIFLAFNLN